MGYEKDVLIRARERHQEAVELHRQQSRRQREAVYEALPEVKSIDHQLRLTMAEVMAQAFRQGEDPSGALAEIRDRNLCLQRQRETLLRQAGYAPEVLDDGPLCRKCGDSGYVGEKMCICLETYCREEQRRELTSLITDDATFDDFSLDWYPTVPTQQGGLSPRQIMEWVYEDCVNYASHFDPKTARNLLLIGDPGLGKTFLSACIAREVVDRGYSVVYDTAIHLFSCMEKQKFGGATEEDLRTVERMQLCDLLILDDLGTETLSNFVHSALYTIINDRLLAKKPTIISTNFVMDRLTQRYIPQIISRLEGDYHTLTFVGNDIRKLKKAQREK